MKDSLPPPPIPEILAAFRCGDESRGLELFREAGGDLFALWHGYAALDEVLAAMPDGAWRRDETVMGAHILHLAKQGRAGRAQAQLADPDLTFERSYKSEFYALCLAIHLGDTVSPAQLERWLAIERLLPEGEPLLEGLYYNAILVFLVRHGRTAEARVIGRRAIAAYRDARHQYLEHYIHLHLADLCLMEGRLREARRCLTEAGDRLAASGKLWGNEPQIAEILHLALDYETGHIDHIPDRAGPLREALVTGDSWAEVFEQLARIAVKSLYFRQGRSAALAELERFREGYAQRHGGSSEVLAALEVAIDRLDWRLGDVRIAVAALDCTALRSPIGACLMEEIGATPAIPATPRTPRAAIVEALQAAGAERSHARRRLVERALWHAVKEGHAAPFLDRREVLSGLGSRLSTGRFARGHVQLARLARHAVGLVEGSYWVPDSLRARGVTHRQFRVITALQSGATNKEIARSLGMSGATVKYHLAQLYAMFGISRRGELLEIVTEKRRYVEN